MSRRDTILSLFILEITLYVVKVACVIYFLLQVYHYHRFTKHELKQQDKFTKRSLKMMSIAYIAGFINYTYQIVLLIG